MIAGTEKSSPYWLWVKESSGLKAQIDIPNGVLIARNLVIEFMDMIFEAGNPMSLLCMTVVSFLLALADELCKVLNEVSNLCHAESRDCRADHANDSRGKGLRVVVTPGWSVQQKLLGGGHGFSGLGFS